MKIEEDDMVVFKSEPHYFNLEQRGLKTNAVRLLTYGEMRQVKGIPNLKKIRIECTDERLDAYPPFTRELTSIVQIGELCGYYLFVLSWRHPFFVDEVIVLKEAINDIVSDPETKRRIYNRASELMERRKTENKKTNEQIRHSRQVS